MSFAVGPATVRSLVAIFVVEAGEGRVPVGGATMVIQDAALVGVTPCPHGVAIQRPASCM